MSSKTGPAVWKSVCTFLGQLTELDVGKLPKYLLAKAKTESTSKSPLIIKVKSPASPKIL